MKVYQMEKIAPKLAYDRVFVLHTFLVPLLTDFVVPKVFFTNAF